MTFGNRGRAEVIDGRRWAMVDYAPGARRHEWCREGRVGLVIAGVLEYEFEDGGDPLTVAEGDAFCLSTARTHRGRNLADGPTRIFLIDDPHEPAQACIGDCPACVAGARSGDSRAGSPKQVSRSKTGATALLANLRAWRAPSRCS